MFQNTADTEINRRVAGIATGSEKPFMYYNGSIKAFGEEIGMVSSFELRGKTGIQVFHTIQSNPVGETFNSDNISTKQVPYGGTRNASIIREGREQFDMELDVILTDPKLFHQLRTHRQTSGTIGANSNLILLHFTKPFVGSTDDNARVQSIRIMLDDYIITEAPIPVPDDKGLLRSKIMVQPQSMKVITQDTMYHS
tara:strand:- start:91 stop:681 length:591 start_codon:yes stop_codon:yes gene_type:complete